MIDRDIEIPNFRMRSVEIIIPFHGEHRLVSRLMENIFNTVYTNRYQITLVDDGSENDNFIKEIAGAKIPGVVCIRKKHGGFGSAINHALKNSKNQWIPWVLIMHSDVLAEDSKWLLNLGETLQILKKENVKMISPKTNNPGCSDARLEGKLENTENVILDDGYLPLYCSLCHRDLFKAVGVFREYPYAGCEAEEFAIRMRQKGYKQAVCGTSYVSHENQGTLRGLLGERRSQVGEILRKTREEFEVEFKLNEKVESQP